MTAVAFHFGMADRLAYACRLLRKATRAGARVVVTGPASLLDPLDRMLWTFQPLEFVPHWRGPAVAALPARLADTPVVLTDKLEGAAACCAVLVNLHDEVPEGFDAFERVIELVGAQEGDRAQARTRWKHYAAQGMTIERHEVSE